MAGIQGSEVIVILLLALVVLGPKRLPEMARKLGRWSVELRQAARELRSGLEAEVRDLKEIRRDLEAPIQEVRQELRQVNRDLDQAAADTRRLRWVGPEPSRGPTSEDALADLDRIEGESAQEDEA